MSTPSPPLLDTILSSEFAASLEQRPVRRGKVRDIFDLGDRLLLVSTDRISAFDWVLPSGIPDKGRVLTQISEFWFQQLGVPHHLLTMELTELRQWGMTDEDHDLLRGRSMIVRKCEVTPVECVIRGYLEGSGWREYQATGAVCGIALPAGLKQCDRLPEPIFTPATKAEEGHDENISFEQMCAAVGEATATTLRERSLEIYRRGAEAASTKGILIADTKFEWGEVDGELILIDEVMTPDSSRFWPADQYEPGHAQLSFDKQFVREHLDATDWDKNIAPPALPQEIVEKTRQKYIDAFERLTGKSLVV